jgi:uncharacterized membrane protein
MLKQLTCFFVLFLTASFHPYGAFAQGSALDEVMMESGKFNVVFTVVVVLIVVLLIYLVLLDRRLRKLEQQEKIQK